ncbi:MAG: TIGR04211 family SH3 domain-containing protein [Gammaproteobacteria bacterium]|jgi:SH3 domain protein|nr:TIGR04211 family SH3 domain-containing protein [Gammaproteobacteria bacterium]MBK8993888.1 TIGR04211 family SH3 domain-containing protein [Gammaproteobacteria bacterium]MBK9466953.1 TIGR04211 family SH3 domain-containing protein [Gammaproteobacteria bacterium]MBP6479486.1 TIGR04211 family SH3 domain-containing protein [Pseudomonadales bacterium]MBP7909648.1 TIGR04211 family SH3 domain-containing protein [Pseudomonadales bacterium]
MFSRLAGALLLSSAVIMSVEAQEQRYVEDTRAVPLREGAALDQRTLLEVPTGTPVVVVQEQRDTGWALVRSREGTEGWMPLRFLKREPGARYQVVNALRLLGQPDDGSVTLTAAIEQGRKELADMAVARDALQAELTELKQLSSNATQLDASNRDLNEQLHVLKNRIGVLEADNQRLRDDSWQKWFINGVWATGIGGLLTLLLPRLIPQRKRRSEWV